MTQTEVQRLLVQWGIACRRESARLCLPRISQIQVMIEHVRRETRLRKGARKKRLKPVQKPDRAYGEPRRKPTAKGVQTPTKHEPSVVFNSTVMEVDHEIASMPDWMQSALIRTYLYGQADRKACQDLRVPKEVYRMRRLAAEEYLGERLEMRRVAPARASA